MLRLATFAMGTRFELVLDAEDEPRARAAGEHALELVERCDARFSLFRSDSLIARINREAFERPVRVDHETFELLAECLALREATQRAFDVAVGPLMRTWGFRGTSSGLESGAPRGTFELDAATRAVRFTSANTALDLGAIAKGHALDAAAESLRECGIERALLHGGTSSVIAIGAPLGEPWWSVQLGAASHSTARLRDNALGFSAPRGRTASFAGHEVGHVIDPRSGKPAALELQCAVVGPSARACDAWSTAAVVLAARDETLDALCPNELSVLLGPLEHARHVCGDPSVFDLRPLPVCSSR